MTKTVKDKLSSTKFKEELNETVENVITKPAYTKRVTVALLDSDEFIDPVAMLVKTDKDKKLEATSKREHQSRCFVETAAKMSSFYGTESS